MQEPEPHARDAGRRGRPLPGALTGLAAAAGALAVAAIAAAAAAVLILRGRHVAASVPVGVAAASLAWASLVARVTKDERLVLCVRAMDPVLDAAALGSLAWALRAGSPRAAAAAMAAMGFSFVAVYERARAESLGFRTTEGLGYRLARAAVLVAGLAAGVVEPALWVVAALAGAAAGARGASVARQRRRDPERGRPAASAP